MGEEESGWGTVWGEEGSREREREEGWADWEAVARWNKKFRGD